MTGVGIGDLIKCWFLYFLRLSDQKSVEFENLIKPLRNIKNGTSPLRKKPLVAVLCGIKASSQLIQKEQRRTYGNPKVGLCFRQIEVQLLTYRVSTIYNADDPRLSANCHHLFPGKRNPRVRSDGVNDCEDLPFP